ncbi:MAG: NUDIX hydrolase [Bacteroidales bacterium]|nr:NUDIX hydrolase [Bacteroidales bacterium]
MKDSKTTATHDDRRWTVLSSKYLWRRPWLTVRLEHVRLANGREAPEYYVLEYPDWVNVIAITKDGEMVMIRQYRHGIGRSDYELCAGVIEQGENPEEAARRELLEETGFGGGEWTQFARLAPNPSSQTNWAYSYLAVGVEKIDTQHLDGAEDLSVHLMSKSQVLQLLRDGEIIQALMVAPLWKYFATSGML